MIELAADAWPRWKQNRRHLERIQSERTRSERAEWIAQRVNERLKHGDHIAKNWVSLHQREIEEKVERRNHATS
jgi:hypothetical protein